MESRRARLRATMKRMVRLLGVATRTGLGASLLLALACGGPQEPAGEGESCYRDADCAPGLVCVPGANKDRTCSDDIGGLISQVERPEPPPEPDAGAMDDGSVPMDDGSVPMDDAGSEPPADGG